MWWSVTCCPAIFGGYFAMLSAVAYCPRGCRIWSDCMWLNRVDDTRHNDFPSAALLAMMADVAGETTTSWNPASTWPPIKISNCIPAYKSWTDQSYSNFNWFNMWKIIFFLRESDRISLKQTITWTSRHPSGILTAIFFPVLDHT